MSWVVDTEAINAGTSAARAPLALVASKATVARDLQIQVKIGAAIREHRIRDHHELTVARQEKQEWLARTMHEQLSAREKEVLSEAMTILTKLIDE